MSIEGPQGVLTDLAARHQELAILALLTTSPGHRITRDKLLSILWPERGSRQARNSLNVALHSLRKSLCREAIRSVNDDLELDTDIIDSDLLQFETAIESEAWDEAAAAYHGPFLDGFYLQGVLEFEDWARAEREANARQHRSVLEKLAVEAEEASDIPRAVEWWHRLATEDPSSARVTVRLMLALEANGDRGRALELAAAHAEHLRVEYDADPDPDVETLAKRLREGPINGLNGTEFEVEYPQYAFRVPGLPRNGGWLGRLPIRGAMLANAALATLLLLCTELPEYDSRRVVAAPFENRTGDPALESLGLVAADAIVQGLAGTGFAQPVSSLTTLQMVRRLGDEMGRQPSGRQALALAEETGAGLLITGAISRDGEALVFDTRITDVPTGKVLGAPQRVTVPQDRPQSALAELRDRTVGALAAHFDLRLTSWAHAASPPPSHDAYHHYASGLDWFLRARFDEAARAFHRAADADSLFTAPLMWALYAHRFQGHWARGDSIVATLRARNDRLAPWDRAMLDYHAAHQEGDHRAAHEAMRRVVQITPDSEWVYKLAVEAYSLNNSREVVEVLAGLDPTRGWLRLWPTAYWTLLADAHHQLESYQRELEIVKRGQEQSPASEALHMVKARALAGAGETDAVIALVEELKDNRPWQLRHLFKVVLELEAHGHEAAARHVVEVARPWFESPMIDEDDPMEHHARGFFFYAAGEWEKARRHLEVLDPPSSVDPDFKGMLAMIALHRGDRQAAIDASEWMEGFGSQPYNYHGQYTLWRARLAAQLGKREQAGMLLRKALLEGAPPGGLHFDPDFERLRDYGPFKELTRPKS